MPAHGPAVVIGGASGIGASVAARLRDDGGDVVVWDIAPPHDIHCDLRDPEEILRAATATLETLGVPTTVTVTAGIGHSGMLADASVDEWDQVMATNVRGAWLAMRAFARPMSDGEGGSIVAIGSVSARLADRSMGIYCASKAALDMVVRVAAIEWGPRVRVNGVAPGVTDTPMLGRIPRSGPWLAGVGRRTALGRIGAPDDIAETVLAVHGMSWVTGQSIPCDGGLSLFSPIDPTGAGTPNS
jgi:NAD(P)-dependent dehydrogenase (short-subunit alcohol dehydrogenase family)